MALVLPVSCSAFYLAGDDGFSYVEKWEDSPTKEHGSCRETENYLTRKLAYDSGAGCSQQQFDTDCENNSIAHDSLYATAQYNSDQTRLVESGREADSEPRETAGSEADIGEKVQSSTGGQCERPVADHLTQALSHHTQRTELSQQEITTTSRVDAKPAMIKEGSSPRAVVATAHKRKLEFEELRIPDEPPRKISIRDNTPKQRRDEKKRILKMSVQKLKRMEDPEVFLHRAVLINNTMKKMQREIKEEKRRLIYGESIENITFPAKIHRDCEYERDVLCDSQTPNTNLPSFYDECFDFYDCSHSSERLGDGGFTSPIFPSLQLDANKNESCKAEALMEKTGITDMDCVFNNLISALET